MHELTTKKSSLDVRVGARIIVLLLVNLFPSPYLQQNDINLALKLSQVHRIYLNSSKNTQLQTQ